MNAAVGDVLNQGRFGVYVSNISEEGVLVQGNNLWMPRAGDPGESVRFENMANAMGVELGGWSFGAQFGDLNNDGFLDLYVTNGNVSLDRNRTYWYDYSKVAGGNRAIISDAANWPPLDGRSLSGYQQKRVWLNDGAGQFKEVAQLVGVTDVYDGRSVALADFGNRGVLDVVVANQNGPLLLYKNTVSPEQPVDRVRTGRAAKATAAPLGRRSACSGTASSRCRKSPAAAVSARRISGGCISAWARPPASIASRSAGHRAKSRPFQRPPSIRSIRLKEPS